MEDAVFLLLKNFIFRRCLLRLRQWRVILSFPVLLYELSTSYKKYKMLLRGDFNVCLLKRDPASEKFTNLLQSFNLHKTIHEPTRVTRTSKTLINNIFVSDEENNIVGRRGNLISLPKQWSKWIEGVEFFLVRMLKLGIRISCRNKRKLFEDKLLDLVSEEHYKNYCSILKRVFTAAKQRINGEYIKCKE
ncbi:hypothetical protein HHI36_016618 [Cryptolaemus montrouzieri]|uniref:Uncharacterized protein n=1 Tax=Cryptolaemus montrouzieri TaxID=559131 RepID=A0ABD2NKN7_9CUCU